MAQPDPTPTEFVLASGQGAVAIGGDAQEMVIITGDGNTVSLSREGIFAFHLLDDAFRQRAHAGTPAALYDGTRPNWANIARGDDAPRRLYRDLWTFATDPGLPPQRIGLILGLAGEGKTTLLMRLAWDLAAAGYPVLWRHSGTLLPNCRIPLTGNQPPILCFDRADGEDHLPQLVGDLHEVGIPFVILGSARFHEWGNAGLESALRGRARFQTFRLGALDEGEVRGVLEKLERANKLDRLADLSPKEWVRHFLDHQKAAGQLLPAMLTARSGAADFSRFVLSVLERVAKREDGEFLLLGHALISAVHRFSFWIGRDIVARAMGRSPEDLHVLLRRLEGELLEVTEAEERRLYTRHPVIAEKVFSLATEHRFVCEAEYLYEMLFRALGEHLRAHPRDPQRKLLTMIPLALKRQREYAAARRIFQFASEAGPLEAPVWQAWALMEKGLGNGERARELFQRGVEADPTHAPVWQAWALMEAQLGNHSRALELLKEGLGKVKEPEKQGVLLSCKGSILGRRQRFPEAEEAFRRALSLDERNPLIHYHFAADCLLPQGRREEACRHLHRALQLAPRKPRDRQRIQTALRQHCPPTDQEAPG